MYICKLLLQFFSSALGCAESVQLLDCCALVLCVEVVHVYEDEDEEDANC